MRSQDHNSISLRRACEEPLAKFFAMFPDEQFRITAYRAIEAVLARRDTFPGDPGGWAGGVLYAVNRWLFFGQTPFLNNELEVIVGASMHTIRKRSEQIWHLIKDDGHELVPPPKPSPFCDHKRLTVVGH